MTCTNLTVFPQIGSTCWFNALLTTLFYSENTRNLLHSKQKDWKMSRTLYKIFKNVLKITAKPYKIKPSAYDFFKVITPEYILLQLHEHDKENFNYDPRKQRGYFNTLYLPRLLSIFGITNIIQLDAVENDNGRYDLYYSNVYNGYELKAVETSDDPIRGLRYYHKYNFNKISLPNLQNLDLVTIRFTTEKHHPDNIHTRNLRFEDIVRDKIFFNGEAYINDCLLLSSYNSKNCNKSHAIAGVTCEGKRYIYNGWMRGTSDRAMNGNNMNDSIKDYPCELMEYDWLNEKISFCLNLRMCKLDKSSHDDINKNVCFNIDKGDRTFIYINETRTAKTPSPVKPIMRQRLIAEREPFKVRTPNLESKNAFRTTSKNTFRNASQNTLRNASKYHNNYGNQNRHFRPDNNTRIKVNTWITESLNNSLIEASKNGHLDVVKSLINAGADVHAFNDYAFRVASLYGHEKIVKFLEKHATKHEKITY